MKKTRVLVTEDSLTVRKHICAVLATDPEIEIVGEAADGKEAIELCGALKPDIVTMDMIMPIMSGLAATEYIMAHCPTPILVVSSSFNRGELFKSYDALAAGAVDVMEKPRGDEPEGVWENGFLAQVKLVSRIRVITHPRARLSSLHRPRPDIQAPRQNGARRLMVLAIGASTGGPGAILDVLRSLPASFDRPILLVLHISEPFGAGFAEWLNDQVSRPVAYARDGEPVLSVAGRVAMAPPGLHLAVQDGCFRLTGEAERHSCRPSVDVLFESVAAEFGASATGVLLTGMGRDGAQGLLAIRQAGGFTIAQDEASCVVYGMPREAVLLGAAERILPLKEIGPVVGTLMSPGREAL